VFRFGGDVMVSDDEIKFKRKMLVFRILNFRTLKLKIGRELNVLTKTAVRTAGRRAY
jgi:hypothetical protein